MYSQNTVTPIVVWLCVLFLSLWVCCTTFQFNNIWQFLSEYTFVQKLKRNELSSALHCAVWTPFLSKPSPGQVAGSGSLISIPYVCNLFSAPSLMASRHSWSVRTRFHFSTVLKHQGRWRKAGWGLGMGVRVQCVWLEGHWRWQKLHRWLHSPTHFLRQWRWLSKLISSFHDSHSS